MTPAEFHFISRLTDVAKNLTLRNAADNTTVATIMSAEVSELKAPMFWIQLGLIPIPPIIACYVFTKVADYIGRCITKCRQPRVELRSILHPVSQATSYADDLAVDRIAEDTQRVEHTHQKIDENHDSTSQGFKDMERAGMGSRVPRGGAEDEVLTGNKDTHGMLAATSLTRQRPSGDAQRGIGRHGRVGSGSQGTKRDGWWFDSRWD